MKQGVPFVAFSLHTDDDALHVSTLDGSRVRRNEVQESTLSDLALLNQLGLEEAARTIGMYVLGLLQISHPDKFAQYPNLIVSRNAPPTRQELASMHERLRQLDAEQDQ